MSISHDPYPTAGGTSAATGRAFRPLLRRLRLMPVVLAGLLSIVASGGGGGGGDGGGGDDGESPQPVVYEGITTAAKITTQNANLILSVVLGGESESLPDIPLSVVAQDDDAAPLAPALRRGDWLRRLADAARPPSRLAVIPSGVAVDRTTKGKVSGSRRVTGNIDANGTGTLNIRFDNFNDGDELTFDGEVTLKIDAYEAMYEIFTDMQLDMALLRVWGTDSDFSMSGKLRLQSDLESNTETLSLLSVNLRNNRSGTVNRYAGLILTTVYDDLLKAGPMVVSESAAGRVYVQDAGYVDVTTVTPARCDGCDEFVPASGGPLVMTGDASTAWVILVSARKVRIEVDADGDGEREDFRVYFWSDLTGEPAPNEPPVAGTPLILPEAAYTTDELSVDVSAFSDPDGDPLAFGYVWYRDGSPIDGQTGATLGADNFVKNQAITVTVTASDGEYAASADSPSNTILDSPPVLSASPPATAGVDGQTSFVIAATDADGDTPVFSVLHGPAGLAVDAASGRVTWTPSQPLFEQRVPVRLAVHVQGGDAAATYSTRITLEDPARRPPLVRSGPLAPGSEHVDALAVADFDGDGTDEILTTDTRKLLYTLKYRGGGYVQDWVYPFDLPQAGYISALAAHDLDGDGRPEMLVGAGTRLVVLDGNDHQPILAIDSPLGMFTDVEAADIDKDGNLEIVALASSAFQSGEHILAVYGADGQPKWQSEKMNLGDHLAIGDVDGDAALEIVTAGGRVIDGSTHVTEWNRDGGFSTRVDTGDLDGDGIEEIVGSTRYSTVNVFDAVNNTQLWQLPDPVVFAVDSGAVLVANVDEDPQAEVITTAGQFGDVVAYDAETGTPVEKWRIDQQGSGVGSLALGSLDDDGPPEIVWTTNQSSTAVNKIVIADLTTTAPWVQLAWTNTDAPLLKGPYLGAQWLTVAPGQRRAVFSAVTIAPSANTNEIRLLSLDPASKALTRSTVTGENRFTYGSVPMDGADVDASGVHKVLLAFPTRLGSSPSGGFVSLYDFTSDAMVWAAGPYDDDPRRNTLIRHADVNDDGMEEFIVLIENYYGTTTELYVYDVNNDKRLWQSAALPGARAHDLEVADLDGDGAVEIVTATLTPGDATIQLPVGHLSAFEYDPSSGGFVARGSQDIPAGSDIDDTRIHLALGNFSGNAQLEVAVSTQIWQATGGVLENVVQIRGGVDLALQSQFTSADPIGDLIAAPGPGGHDNLLLASYRDVSLYWYNTIDHVLMTNPISGAEIWRSPPLLGQVQNNAMSLADTDGDGTPELILGTSAAMCITR